MYWISVVGGEHVHVVGMTSSLSLHVFSVWLHTASVLSCSLLEPITVCIASIVIAQLKQETCTHMVIIDLWVSYNHRDIEYVHVHVHVYLSLPHFISWLKCTALGVITKWKVYACTRVKCR